MSLPNPVVADPGATRNFEWLSERLIAGKGSPEARIFARPGSLYLREDGGVGSSLYVKETTVDINTGWKAV